MEEKRISLSRLNAQRRRSGQCLCLFFMILDPFVIPGLWARERGRKSKRLSRVSTCYNASMQLTRSSSSAKAIKDAASPRFRCAALSVGG